ncbi:deoxyribonuclease IV [Candidatus Roizmanbacteria bacterium]|nr:deoxyribonuclease IV [Candidatus Roizmanbacteria bacterium]
MLKLGAHQSIEGGYTKALKRIKNIGGNCLQMFSSSPRGWNFTKIDEVDATEFVERKNELKIDPVYFHASYLINLADEERIGSLSKLSLIAELSIAPKLRIRGSIVHLGSFKTKLEKNSSQLLHGRIKVVVNNIKEILSKSQNSSYFIIENSGNRKIGQDLTEIATITKQVNDDRVRICLDICHLYSAGYDLSSAKKLKAFFLAFDKLIGLEKLEVIHANDSRDPFNSGRDRHENIGKGTIPLEAFKLLLNHPKTKHLPFIIETPGFDDQGPDKRNLDILKKMLD